jgi:hypothetical protein
VVASFSDPPPAPPVVLLFCLFSLVYGVCQIVLPLRQTGRSVMEKHAA